MIDWTSTSLWLDTDTFVYTIFPAFHWLSSEALPVLLLFGGHFSNTIKKHEIPDLKKSTSPWFRCYNKTHIKFSSRRSASLVSSRPIIASKFVFGSVEIIEPLQPMNIVAKHIIHFSRMEKIQLDVSVSMEIIRFVNTSSRILSRSSSWCGTGSIKHQWTTR